MSKEKAFTVTGHTGCLQTADNSLDSITKAAENGADIVEFDLNFDSNGEPVLSHNKPEGGEFTLDEAFRRVSEYDFLQVNVDVKNTAHLEKVVPIAKKHGLDGRFFYTGIFESDVDAVKEKSPDVPYYLNIKVRKLQSKRYLRTLVAKVRDCGAVGINFNHKSATKRLVEAFLAADLLVSVWTVNEEKDMKRILALSPDNITTRHPDMLGVVRVTNIIRTTPEINYF